MEIVSSKSPSHVGAPLEPTSFVVASRAMTELLAMAKSAAESSAPILITGESGVGKDLVARYIHGQSRRRLAPFVAVNCAGLIEARLESELFGHVHGNMTDVFSEKRGKLRLAHRGTLFLDQVGDMIRRMQAWLLRFLESGEIQTVGSDDIAGACRRSRGCRHQSQPERSRRRRPVPRGPLVPAARHPPPRAAAPGAGRGHSRADAALPGALRAGAELHGRCASRVAAIQLAGQRPRAPERRRTARLVVRGRRRRRRAPSRLDAQRARARSTHARSKSLPH